MHVIHTFALSIQIDEMPIFVNASNHRPRQRLLRRSRGDSMQSVKDLEWRPRSLTYGPSIERQA
jgi:hypothetical protein